MLIALYKMFLIIQKLWKESKNYEVGSLEIFINLWAFYDVVMNLNIKTKKLFYYFLLHWQ